MMFLTENGTAYSDNFFHAEGNIVVNNFTGKEVGILVRTMKSTSYLCIETSNKKPWHKRLVGWLLGTEEEYHRHIVPDDAEGTLSDTMRALEKERE